MSSIVSAITGSSTGAGFQAQGAPTLQTTDKAQLDAANQNTQMGLAQQQDFIKALQNQKGISNQSSVFNQMQGVANGTGPNPAQAMLANSTGQDVSNQAALMAGQRGSGANAGMMARQAAMQGANTQQQAAGQGAALQAQQSMSALGQMGNIAGQQVSNQGQQVQAYNQNALSAQGQQLGAASAMNSNNVAMQSNINSANAGVQGEVVKGQANILGNMTGAGGAATTLLAAADGGMIQKYADGGATEPSVWDNIKSSMDETPATGGNAHPLDQDKVKGFQSAFATGGKVGPQSKVGQHFCGGGSMSLPKMAEGGAVPALVSPGEKYLSPDKVQKVKQGANPMAEGETIPGKAKVKGAKNSYANDTVPKTLEEGGIVLPRSVTQSKNPQWAAHRFVSAILKEQSLKKGK